MDSRVPSSAARPPILARLVSGLGLSAGMLVLLVVLLELAGLVVPALSRRALDPEVKVLEQGRVQPHPYLAYAVRPGFRQDNRAKGGDQVSHNSLGFRGPETTWEKPEGVYRIVCLGGSSTYGFGPSSDATNWPARLEVHLNAAAPPRRVEVINGACQGYSTFESLINLSLRLLDFEPDLVITYHAINDMRCALWREARNDNTNWRANWPVERPSAIDRLLASSTTYRLLRWLDLDWRRGRSGDIGWYVIVGNQTEEWALTPAAEIGFAAIRRNLEEITALARFRGAQVLFGLEAMRWSDLPLKHPATAEEQRIGLERVLTITREVGAELGVPVVETGRALEKEAARQVAETGADRIFTSEVHMTDEGCDLLARTFAAAILERGWLR